MILKIIWMIMIKITRIVPTITVIINNNNNTKW